MPNFQFLLYNTFSKYPYNRKKKIFKRNYIFLLTY
ncbi:hypothetical protein [Staphylococcus phage vB_ScaM-V1SC04]|nr:hypothetical protein [Staphylococcus phage vB_ScaM-V1SC04]